jgi:hypothetical protein
VAQKKTNVHTPPAFGLKGIWFHFFGVTRVPSKGTTPSSNINDIIVASPGALPSMSLPQT